MKKKILSFAIVSMLLSPIVSFASNNEISAIKSNANELVGKREEKKLKGDRINPFEGLSLNDNQKEQLNKLREERKAERNRKMQERKSDKLRADSTFRARQIAEKRDYLHQIKSILTPEQYVTFLENMVVKTPYQRLGKDSRLRFDRRQHANKSDKSNASRTERRNQNQSKKK